MKFKLKKRKGSVLSFIIIIFSVLTILGTFTVSFMVTENKQSIHYNNKAQAYYHSRSGAEIVEKALIERMNSFDNDVTKQKEFVDKFDVATEVDVDLDYLRNYPITVKTETLNGKKILTVSSTVTYQNITQTVKKGIYSTSSMISSQGFLPGSGELFIYLGDQVPQEKLNNGKSRSIPEEYVSKVPDEEKSRYKTQDIEVNPDNYNEEFEFIEFDNVEREYYFKPGLNTIDDDSEGLYFIDGDLRLTNGVEFDGDFNIYIKGKLKIDGTVKFNGNTNIYVNETVDFGDDVDLQGAKSNSKNKLGIYIFNSLNKEISVTNYNFGTTSNNGKFKIQANLYVNNGNVNLGFPKDAVIDGHLVYNGNQDVNIKTNSNSNDRLITGSIYAPLGTVQLGIYSYKIATILGGQVIGNSINVYPNNQNQGEKFYKSSTEGRIENNPIPIDITDGIDVDTIKYESFFID